MGGDQPDKKAGDGPTGERGRVASISLSGSFFGEDLESLEARELALLLEARGIRVHLEPRWLEEKGVERG
jgi:hypothetical protein